MRKCVSRLPVMSALVLFSMCFGVARAADFVANCDGSQEVPSRDTRARGTAIFQLSDDGLALHYKLVVANIDNVVAAHIHAAPEGSNGPVVAFLFAGSPPGSGPTAGKIAEGSITADLLLGPLSGMSIADLVALLESGDGYVNVHTNDGVDPTNTGPGDFASGEVRGQIRSSR